jgi:putative colanic acid biosynthesis glycosyltransferase
LGEIELKVLQINSVCGEGSTGRIATDIYKLLEEQGHDCMIAYGRGKAPSGIKTIKIGSNIDNYFHVAKTRVFDKHGFGSSKATVELIRQVKEYNPDVIHLHNIHGYYINVEILFEYLKEANKPVIWTLHDCWPFTGHCSYFSMVECDLWKKGCNKCPHKSAYPSSLVMNGSKWNFSKKMNLFTSIKNLKIVTPSDWLASLVRQSFLKNYDIEVINNGIDLDLFKPTQSEFVKKHDLMDKFIILGVANIWDKRKGLSTFIELSRRLDENYHIVLVGLTDKQIKELPQNILGITKTKSIKELAEIYTAADVFVNPSLEETMGLVTVEALACGTPAIVFNATAVPEVVDETCGIVVEKGNLNKLVESIISCNNDNFDSENCIKRAKIYEKNKKYNEYIHQYVNGVGE